MSVVSKALQPLRSLKAALAVCLLASPVAAQENQAISPEIEEWGGIICTLAKDRSWERLVAFLETEDIDLDVALEQVVCLMAETTATGYYGNIWEASARYSGFVADVIKLSTRYLLKDNNEHDIFVSLVRGTNTRVYWPRGEISQLDIYGNGGVFYEFREAWRLVPPKRPDLIIAARAICLSIDRFNVQGLDDIRANECMTPPFVFPPRE